ncbi:hypothetical protein, partial [Streptomyces sp. C1-2]|uniref:hypothetical protein n=1 Tax=Streptomyces sp. C1-2 TaxID=2720022 RepID=UPI0014326CDF
LSVPPVDFQTNGHEAYAARPYEKPDPLESALLAAWNAGEPEEQPATAEPAGPCPVFRDCTVDEPGHVDHYSRTEVTGTDDMPIVDAGMVGFSGSDHGAVVYLRNADYADAASLKAKTAELRRFLDEVDALADRVFADHEA